MLVSNTLPRAVGHQSHECNLGPPPTNKENLIKFQRLMKECMVRCIDVSPSPESRDVWQTDSEGSFKSRQVNREEVWHKNASKERTKFPDRKVVEQWVQVILDPTDVAENHLIESMYPNIKTHQQNNLLVVDQDASSPSPLRCLNNGTHHY